jgi:hypothetical protein
MQVLLEDISRTLGACAVTLPGCQDDNISSAAVPQAVHTYNQRQQQLRDFSLMSEHIPVDLSRLSLSNLEDPPAAMPTRMRGSGTGAGGGRGASGGVGRGLRNVSTSSYRAGPPPLMTHTGGMERQLA